jgi:hypothetical protein
MVVLNDLHLLFLPQVMRGESSPLLDHSPSQVSVGLNDDISMDCLTEFLKKGFFLPYFEGLFAVVDVLTVDKDTETVLERGTSGVFALPLLESTN